jgi:diadenosine tetraphosphate (Ap4A) HIT family hydrolase
MAYFYSPFRKQYDAKEQGTEEACVFCDTKIRSQMVTDGEGHVVENEHYQWIINYFPRFEGHTMLVPKRHLTCFADETKEEVLARHDLLVYASEILTRAYANTGIEVFLQRGDGSASTIKHLHWHLIPAKADDPLRGFEKMGHFVAKEEDEERIIRFPQRIEHAREGLGSFLAPCVKARPYTVDIKQ